MHRGRVNDRSDKVNTLILVLEMDWRKIDGGGGFSSVCSGVR